jgi:transcriptional regulator with XRE-family HTH domain
METGAPIAERVATNLRYLRQAREITLAKLSEQLAKQGRPMGISALSKVELGQRGIDVDDLVAFADALGTSVSDLLGDPAARGHELAYDLVADLRTRLSLNERVRRQHEIAEAEKWSAIVDFAAEGPAELEAVCLSLREQFKDEAARLIEQLRADMKEQN